eukprot:superscaffoldBa00001444_g10582
MVRASLIRSSSSPHFCDLFSFSHPPPTPNRSTYLLRSKARTAVRREDRGVSGEVFSPAGSRPGLAPGCSANSSSPLSDPPLLHSLLDASLHGWCGPNKPQPSGQRGNGTAASWASTSRPSTTLQTNSAVGHKPRATWNLSLPAVHGWFTPQNPSQAKGLNVYCT